MYAGVDDDAAPVADKAMMVPQLSRHDPKIDYLVHDEDDQLDQLNVFFFDLIDRHTQHSQKKHSQRN